VLPFHERRQRPIRQDLDHRLPTALREERGLTYLFVSHNLAVIAHMCARVEVMNTGRIVEQVAPGALASGALANPYAQQLLKSSAGYDRQAAAALVSYD
jgi:peptide/nickel transport system ATP-binding protein